VPDVLTMPGLGLFSATLRGEAGIYLGLLISLVGTLFSAYLTYLEVLVIHALCQWCLASLFTGVLSTTSLVPTRSEDLYPLGFDEP
jgi:uncharacterized membrane protein